MVKSKFEVLVYPPERSTESIQSTLIFGFSQFDEIATLYPERTIDILNIDTFECRTYDRGKCIGVFY